VFDWVNWLVASARTVTANVWVPAFPPNDVTIGINIARATIVSIAPPKSQIIEEPNVAVARLAIHQRTRAL
jgi:hypothetical protein